MQLELGSTILDLADSAAQPVSAILHLILGMSPNLMETLVVAKILCRFEARCADKYWHNNRRSCCSSLVG